MSEEFIPQIKPDLNKLPEGKGPQDGLKIEVNQPSPLDSPAPPSQLPPKPASRFSLKRYKVHGPNNLGGRKKLYFKIGIIVLVLFVINLLFVINFTLKARGVYQQVKQTEASLSSKDLNDVSDELKNLDGSISKLNTSYKFIAWMRIIPFFGGYVGDVGHVIKAGKYSLEVGDLLIEAVGEYADLLGFTGGAGAGDGQETAADRIDFIVKTIPDILPKLDDIAVKMEDVNKEVSAIKPSRYPVKFAGKEVRSNVEFFVRVVGQATDFIKNGKPLIAQTPYLLGLDSPRTYLVIFQNDKELRPTGGFLTAYSIMKVDKAKFEPVTSNDIYNLDNSYKPTIAAPEPIIKYIKGPYVLSKNLRLRDLNWSPDFTEFAKTFLQEMGTVGIEGIDGIIAVDTQVLVYILDVLGPIGVSGYGNFSTETISECNCPQVIYELESFADVEGPVVWDPAGTGKIIYAPANYDNRKKIIGPLMNSILANAFGQPKDKLARLFEAGYKSVMEKHILVYLSREDAQKAAQGFGMVGEIKAYEGDYLHINDANLGGRKSNLYVTEEVSQEISVAKDGSVEKTVNITYKNPEKQDGWLNSVLPNWVRVYVPKGSELISFEGVTEKEDAYEEYGKTVYAGYFELRPQGVAKVTLKYKLPFKVKDNYKLLIQKQPGIGSNLYTFSAGSKEEEFYLKTDKEINIKI